MLASDSTAASMSIALATCNGARFLRPQLASIAVQRRQPTELVVADDASDDDTVAILEDFAAHAPFPVHIHRQPSRVGVAANFSTALRACTGTLIATCDQDDVWHPGRLAAGAHALEDPAVLVVGSDAELIDADGRPLGRRLFAQAGIDSRRTGRQPTGGIASLDLLLARRLVTGATMTLRASLLRDALPIGDGWIHDEWLALQAALRGGRVVLLPDAWVEYRQHSANALGAPGDGFGVRARQAADGRRRDRAERQLRQLRAMRAAIAADPRIPAAHLAALDDRITHLACRAALPTAWWPRTRAVLRELATGRYRSDAMGAWSAVGDLLA